MKYLKLIFPPIQARGYQVEVRQKVCYHAHLVRDQAPGALFGLTIKTLKKCSVADNSTVSLKIIVSDIEEQGPARRAGMSSD